MLQALQHLSIGAWETSFPSIDLALRESIRLNMAGVSFRLNVGSQDVGIGDSDEVIPPKVYAVCAFHFNLLQSPNTY